MPNNSLIQRSKKKLEIDSVESITGATRKQASMIVNEYYKKPREITLEYYTGLLLLKRQKWADEREKKKLERDARQKEWMEANENLPLVVKEKVENTLYYFRDSSLVWRKIDKMELFILEKYYYHI